MKQHTRNKQRITLLGTRISAQKIATLIYNTLEPARTIYNQVQNALLNGIPPQSAYNLPKKQIHLLRRYERAIQLYDDYKHYYGTPRADHIITPAKPSNPQHIAHFFCGTTSDKHAHTYTKYRVTLVKHQNTLHLVCDCPDYTNRGGSLPCKHIACVCMWLTDYMGGLYR